MALFAFIIAVLVVLVFLIEARVLLWIERLFKIENATYRNALKLLITSGIASVIVGAIFILTGLAPSVFITLTSFLIFHYFLKKNSLTSWKKSLGIYFSFGAISILIHLLIILPLRLFVISPFWVVGESMSPTYHDSDYLLANKLNTDFSRGDVIIFYKEELETSFSIKRIVGLPTEKVDIHDGKVFINGQTLSEPYSSGETFGNISLTLSADQYFILGDNRNKSSDSRNFGPIHQSDIEGKVFYRLPH